MILIETWTEEKRWDKIKERLSGGTCGECKERKEGKKGKAIEEMIIRHKDLEIQKKENREEKKGIMVEKIKYGKGSLRIIGIYVNEDMEKKFYGKK